MRFKNNRGDIFWEENVVKKFLSLIIVATVCLIFVEECRAERICVIPDFKDGVADLCIETSGIKIVRLQDSRNGEPQYGFIVPTEYFNHETGEISKHNFPIWLFFKDNNGEWCCSNIDEESARPAQIKLRRGSPIKNYETDERTFVEDIFDKACEYIDVNEIGNTEAERFGEKGNGVMVFFK